MRIIVAHNFYQQAGGEDAVFRAEVELLRRHGNEVETFTLSNDAIDQMGKLRALSATIWNRQTYRDLRQRIRDTSAQVVHFHNTFPLISPAAYKAARDAGATVVQTLHNFRLICPCALLFRDGKPCEQCIGKTVAWPGIQHKCYRQSRQATAAVAAMTAVHHVLGTYQRLVDLYIALSPSARTKLIAGGLPAEKIVLKANFVDPDPGVSAGHGNYATFVGRLSYEKGIETLLEAWRIVGDALPLKIVGDGPLARLVQKTTTQQPNIQWLGQRPLEEVYELIGNAAVHVLPSQCYENAPRVAVEAFAKGTPVITSAHGGMADVVEHHRTGLLFEPGNAADLARQVGLFLCGANTAAMRSAARGEYESKYTGEQNYRRLMEIYALATRRPAESPATGKSNVPQLSEV